MLLVRANQVLAGGSGADPGVAYALADALNRGFTPPVRTYGAIGTGDLTALATTALCLLGEVAWRAPEGEAGPPPRYAVAEALAFISSGAATLGDAALGCHRLRALLHAGIDVAARSFAAVAASAEPLAPAVQAARPHPGQAVVAARVRELLPGLAGDAVRPEPAAYGLTAPATGRVQDPYGYRAFPQVHGAALDALGAAARAVEVDMNAATENPLIAEGRAWHNGNFHSAPIALALDAARAAVVQAASLSVTRLATLMEPGYTGLLPFLADEPGRSGLMILEYVAQDALAELRHLAAPVTTGSATMSHGVEDHAGFATQAARRALAAVEPLEIVLACELVAAARAIRLRAPRQEDELTRGLDPATGDRVLDADIEAARALIGEAAGRFSG
ncbi:aromatic amino acid lyase [Thermocatellispora tengchongensis]